MSAKVDDTRRLWLVPSASMRSKPLCFCMLHGNFDYQLPAVRAASCTTSCWQQQQVSRPSGRRYMMPNNLITCAILLYTRCQLSACAATHVRWDRMRLLPTACFALYLLVVCCAKRVFMLQLFVGILKAAPLTRIACSCCCLVADCVASHLLVVGCARRSCCSCAVALVE
jgi:hypothetical protein